MKRLARLILVAAIGLFVAETTADAQLLKNLLKKATSTETTTTTTTTEATSNGKAAGAALKALYSQYKTDGKVDMSNLTNIMNVATLATNIKGLKGETNKSAFYKDFASGLVLGSGNLVNSGNTSSVMSGLTNLVNNVDLSSLSGFQQKAADAVNTATSTGSEVVQNASAISESLTNILSLFKK